MKTFTRLAALLAIHLLVGCMLAAGQGPRGGRGPGMARPGMPSLSGRRMGGPNPSLDRGRRPAPNDPNQGRPAGGANMGGWLRQHKDMSSQDQERALAQEPGFSRLPAEQQQRLRDRLREFNAMPPEQRERVLQRMDALERMTPEQRERMRGYSTRMQELPEDRKVLMRNALGKLRAMAPEDRKQLLGSDRARALFSDDEREILRGMTELDLAPAETMRPSLNAPRSQEVPPRQAPR